MGKRSKVHGLVRMLDLTRIEYVIENRSESAQSRKRGGV
jgi:hypothetical protein